MLDSTDGGAASPRQSGAPVRRAISPRIRDLDRPHGSIRHCPDADPACGVFSPQDTARPDGLTSARL